MNKNSGEVLEKKLIKLLADKGTKSADKLVEMAKEYPRFFHWQIELKQLEIKRLILFLARAISEQKEEADNFMKIYENRLKE